MNGLLMFFDLPSMMVSGSVLVMAAVIALGSNHRLMLVLARDAALPMGCLGLLIGAVKILVNLEDPTALRPSISVALLPVLYSTILYSFLLAVVPDDGTVEESASPIHWVRMALGMLILAGVIIAAMAFRTSLLFFILPFIDPVSIVLIVVGVGLPALIGFLRSSQQRLRNTLENVFNACLCTVGVGLLLGGIGIIFSLDDPSAIGPYMAVSLLTSLYGGGVMMFCGILSHGLHCEDAPRLKPKNLIYLAMTVLGFLLNMGFIFLSMFEFSP